jgi:hypothetical protein
MNRARLATVVIAFLLSFGCSSGEAPKAKPSPRLVALFGGSKNFDLVQQATDVKLVRLERPPGTLPGAALEPYKEVGEARVLDESQRRDLASLLTTPTSFLWDSAVGCIPDYGSKFEFRRDDKLLVVAICLQCELLTVFQDGKAVGSEEFNPITSQLVKLMQ